MVGPCYDLTADGKPYRVVVLPMETGEPKQHRTLDQRTKDVLDSAKLTFRNPRHPPANPCHIAGWGATSKSRSARTWV